MLDLYEDKAATVRDQFKRHAAIVPDDDNDLTELPRGIYCQGDGTIVLRDHAGADLPYAMTAGQFLPARPVRVLATGTTGTFYAWF